MIYLTATLSPSKEAEFLDIMKVQILDDCKFHGSTTCPNIAYSVVEHDNEQTEAVCQLVAKKLEQYPSPAKIIVYSSCIDTIKELGAALNCHTYYADVGSTKEKDKIQQQWSCADGRVIVASNAFGLGIDQPDVRAVVHVGPIYKIEDYGQESGRGGRDGQRSEAIILVEEGQQEALQAKFRRQSSRRSRTTANQKQLEQEKVDRFISGEKCRRIHLDQQLDGRLDRVQCEDREEKCDVCLKDSQIMEEAEALQQAYIAEEGQAGCEEDEMLGNTSPNSSINIQPNDDIDIQHNSSNINSPSTIRTQASPIWTNDNETQAQANSSQSGSIDSPNNTPSPSNSSNLFEMQAQREELCQSIQRQNQQEGHEVWDLEQHLEEWKVWCPLCFVFGIKNRHSIEACHQYGASDVKAELDKMVDEMTSIGQRRFELFSCCFYCYVPQEICQH
jgi:superfamily II DNA helicase RecQ